MKTSRIAMLVLLAFAAIAHADDRVKLMLDWKPEPEFGGFYDAQESGYFAEHALNVKLKSAGEGAPTWQLVATGKADFATTAADQVLIARSQGADVVAIFTVYQTFPQGIMVHKARGFQSISDVFTNPGVLEAEDDTWLHFLENKYPNPAVKIIGYTGGVGAFLAKSDYSQQCFVTSEPLIAAKQGSDPQTFLIADAGYNPYTTVVICTGDTLRNKADLVHRMTESCRQGWKHYLDDPSKANDVMSKLNTDMDPETFTAAAAVQKPLIANDETAKNGLGTMTMQRWTDLANQLVQLKVIDKAPAAGDCFTNP
jgi:NitT/TauT family transport system substrate-binding protein